MTLSIELFDSQFIIAKSLRLAMLVCVDLDISSVIGAKLVVSLNEWRELHANTNAL